MRKRELFEYLVAPSYQLTSPDRELTDAEFDLLRITVDDFRYVTRPVTRDLEEVAAELRTRSTVLRRLLCESDIFNIGR